MWLSVTAGAPWTGCGRTAGRAHSPMIDTSEQASGVAGTLPGEFVVRRVHRGAAPAPSYWTYGGAGAVPRGALLSTDYLANVPGRTTNSFRTRPRQVRCNAFGYSQLPGVSSAGFV
jgi:hypothetical protein